jgi:hypothetical protein
MEPQSRTTNGPVARGENSWSDSATSSLPDPAEADPARQGELDRLAERLEAELGRPDGDRRAGRHVDVVDAQAGDEGAVGRVEIAQAIAALVEPDLAMQPGHPRVAQLDVVAAAGADADDRCLDVAAEPGVGAAQHVDAAAPDPHAGCVPVDVRDPRPGSEVIERHEPTLP